MSAHVAADLALAHPVQRPLQELLPVCAALDVGAPLLDVRVLAVAEFGLRQRRERPRVNGIQELLGVERHTCDVDRLEPLLDLSLGPLALVNQQSRAENLGPLVGGQAVEIFRIAVIHDRELVRNEPSDTGDTLLAVQHLELVLRDFVEIDQSQRIPLEQRFDDRRLFLAAAIRIEVVALVLRLNGELPAQPEKPFALQLVIHKPIADVGDGDVGSQRGIHFFVPLALRARRWWRIRMRLKMIRG